MSGSINKVTLVGNLGRDPEIRTMTNGTKVANFTIATSESWSDKSSGERKEKTQWHRISVWNENLVKVVENYLKKGSKVYLEGSLETRKYTDKDGNERDTVEVVLNRFKSELVMLDGKGDSAGASSSTEEGEKKPAAKGKPAAKPAPDDDEIPF